MKLKIIIITLLVLVAMRGQAQTKSNLDLCLRDEATGEWLIGLFDEFAIYDGAFWNYAEIDKDRLVLTKDGQQKEVKLKKNGAVIDGKKYKTSILKPKLLPDYPKKDMRTGFTDSNYAPADSVTLTGWIRNIPDSSERLLTIRYTNLVTDDDNEIVEQLDTQGRFAVRLPLLNTTSIWLEFENEDLYNVLEFDKTYLLYFDYDKKDQLWMGDDVRLQNELASHDLKIKRTNVDQTGFGKLDAMKFWAEADSIGQWNYALLEQMVQQHSMLSQRYIDYQKGEILTRQGRDMVQAYIYAPHFKLPKDYMEYVNREFWQKAVKPYTLHSEHSTLLHKYVHYYEPKEGTGDLIQILNTMEGAEADSARALMNTSGVEKMAKKYLQGLFYISLMYNRLQTADSLGCDDVQISALISNIAMEIIDQERAPLPPITLEYAKKHIVVPAYWAPVQEMSDKYVALQQQQDISKSASLKSADDVAGLSDGETILRKICEPYKGKLILLDIWGTWCGPCKEALSHSAEEYERLKDYDIVYLYLANKSSDESWKNVIKQYNILGPNIVHYNLPAAQQRAIERYLKVSLWPHYRLIDRNGNVLDVNADPHDLDSLVQLLNRF